MPPFEKNDKGFKDAMIYESILQFALRNKMTSLIFLTNDKIFLEEEINSVAQEKGISLTVIKSTQEFKEELLKSLSKFKQDILKEKEKKAIAALNTIKVAINSYLKEYFLVPKFFY